MLAPSITNAFTIDVEDYFQVSAFAPYIRRDEWERRECRVERNVDRILALLKQTDTRATFFTLGWIAERYPQLVRAIAAAATRWPATATATSASAISTHAALRQRPADRAKKPAGRPRWQCRCGATARRAFRSAPANLWAFDRAGRDRLHAYSSSIYPIQHDHYGMPDAPRFAHRLRHCGLLEVPATTVRLGMNRNLPSSGGGYFRLLPYAAVALAAAAGQPGQDRPVGAMFYFHPWEIDVDQPRIAGDRCEDPFSPLS